MGPPRREGCGTEAGPHLTSSLRCWPRDPAGQHPTGQTDRESEGRVTGPRTKALGSSQREFSGCKPVCSPTQEPRDGHPERGPDGSSLSSPRKCRQKPQARTPWVRGCSAAGRASSPMMRPWPAAEAAAHPPLLPPLHPEPALRTFPNKYAFQVINYSN